jgi:hypothetical protein
MIREEKELKKKYALILCLKIKAQNVIRFFKTLFDKKKRK